MEPAFSCEFSCNVFLCVEDDVSEKYSHQNVESVIKLTKRVTLLHAMHNFCRRIPTEIGIGHLSAETTGSSLRLPKSGMSIDLLMTW